MIKRVTIILLTLFVISSCVSPKVYKELEDKYASLKKENRNLQTEFEDLKKAHNKLNNEYDDLIQSYEAAKSEAAQLTSELEALASGQAGILATLLVSNRMLNLKRLNACPASCSSKKERFMSPPWSASRCSSLWRHSANWRPLFR